MKCPFCEVEKRGNHIYSCKSKPNMSKDDLRKTILEYNYPYFVNNINTIYNIEKRSLPYISENYGIDFNSIKFLLKYYSINVRGHSEGFLISNENREKTNIKRYGYKNVLSKGCEKYYKKIDTIKSKYGVDNIFQVKEIIEKINDDNYYLEKYGMTKKQFSSFNSKLMWNKLSADDKLIFIEKSNEKRNKTWNDKYNGHPLKTNLIMDKIIKTNRVKYGSDYYFQSDEFLNNKDIKIKAKKTRIKKGYEISEDLLEPFDKYKKKCRYLTNKIKKILFENWDGLDYYDGEYIKGYLNLKNTDRLYPTIDHKISIFHGFTNDISELEICSLENLCITKRTINCSKRAKNYENLS